MRYLFIFLLACAVARASDGGQINVSGSAREVVPPDRATWRFTIYSTAPSVEAAAANARAAQDRLMGRMAQLQVPADTLVSEGMRQGALWRYDQGHRLPDGFFTELSYKLKLTDLKEYPVVSEKLFLDSLIEVQNVELTSTKKASAERDAIRSALVDAREKAETIAQEIHAKLGSVKDVSCQSDEPVVVRGMMMAAARASQPALEPIVVNARVSVTYRIGE